MAHKKGAFQLSLGLIVAVVFAVILLSLSITWIQQMMGSLTDITHKVTEVARDNLMQELAATGKKVGIAAPAVSQWKTGETGSYAIGIRNDNDVARKTFSIGIYLENTGQGLSSTDDWFDFPKTKIIDAGGRDSVDLIISPDPGSQEGIYLFRIVVCRDQLTCGEADYGTAGNLYGAEEFALEIVSA